MVLGLGLERVDAWPDGPQPVHVHDAPAALVELLADRPAVVAVLPAWAAEPARRRLEVASSALGGRTAVACHETALPPLAAGLLAALAAVIAGRAPSAGLLAGRLVALERELVAFALVGGRVRSPGVRPSLADRLRGLWPASRFLVRLGEPSLVHHVARGSTLPLHGMPPDAAFLVAPHMRGAEWFADQLPGAVQSRAPTAAGPGWWRTANLVEAVAYPADVEALAERLFAVPAVACPWCGEPVASVPCPVCGHDLNRALAEVVA